MILCVIDLPPLPYDWRIIQFAIVTVVRVDVHILYWCWDVVAPAPICTFITKISFFHFRKPFVLFFIAC